MAKFPEYAQNLLGRTLDQWEVTQKLKYGEDNSGGNFSSGYFVRHVTTHQVAFLKAIDLGRAFHIAKSMQIEKLKAVEYLATAFNFETTLCYHCRGNRMDRIIHPIANGQTEIDENDPFSTVYFIIFEKASGDIRRHLDAQQAFNEAWILRSLHHTATGLKQLHSVGVAHQDLKPSNVLVMPNDVSKIGDLGAASIKQSGGPRDGSDIAGDPSYAPPELLYRFIDPDWNKRRIGCDFYLLGSLIFFMFSRTTATALLMQHLDPQYYPNLFLGTYTDLRPYLMEAFDKSLTIFANSVSEKHRTKVITLVRQLCHPMPSERGDKQNILYKMEQFNLARVVTQLDLLASRAEIDLKSAANGNRT